MLQRLPSQLETPRGSKFQNHPSSIFFCFTSRKKKRPQAQGGAGNGGPGCRSNPVGPVASDFLITCHGK